MTDSSQSDDRCRLRVMLVDDNPVFLRALVNFLERQTDVQIVGIAGDGAEAVALAQGVAPQLILLDYSLPDMNGLEVLAQLREHTPGIIVIILTMLDVNGYRRVALDAGANDFVAKANVSVDLLPAIRRVTENSTLSPAR